MSETDIAIVHPSDVRAQRALERLLARAGIRKDPHLETTVGLFDENGDMLATGSLYANTLRCLAVDPARRGEGLLAKVLAFLIEEETRRGFGEVFLYTKPESARFFQELGFTEIERVEDRLVFLSNRATAFDKYLARLKRDALVPGRAAAVVMNANPFALGQLHLLEKACRGNDVVHVFVVSEDVSLFSFRDRFRLVREGSAHLHPVMCHPSGNYIVSAATFPSYFLKDEETVTRAHACLDAKLFCRIARTLGITRRYAGEEPYSQITRLYNEEMARELPKGGIEFIEVPRAQFGKNAISASAVRRYIHDGRLDLARPLLPASTYDFLTSEAGAPTIARIRAATAIEHE